jgi:hypothetical protein
MSVISCSSGGIRNDAIDARTYPPEFGCFASEKLFPPDFEFTFIRFAASSERLVIGPLMFFGNYLAALNEAPAIDCADAPCNVHDGRADASRVARSRRTTAGCLSVGPDIFTSGCRGR